MKERFKTFANGYVIDKRISLGATIVILLLGGMAYLDYANSSDKYFIRCSGEKPCFNPYYEMTSCPDAVPQYLCDMETFPGGFQAGTPGVGFFYDFFFLLMGLTLAGAALANHIIYNTEVMEHE